MGWPRCRGYQASRPYVYNGEKMSDQDITAETLAKFHSSLRNDCLIRLRQARLFFDDIERKIIDPKGSINDLGEFQGFMNILDCRMASLATVRRLAESMGAI